jgi:ketosteroid isomerase-like protein
MPSNWETVMPKGTSAAVILFIWGSLCLSQASDSKSDWDSLIEAEQAFAKTSAIKGTREAFLAFLAQDSILFRPNPVPGRKWIEEHPSPPDLLAWEPAFADVAQAGDLGYTTGPWEIRKNDPQSKPSANGQYVTVWRKQEDGSWKVVLDQGIMHHPPAAPIKGVVAPKGDAAKPAKSNRRVELESERGTLLKIDRELGRAVVEKGASQAYLRYLAEDARLLRMKAFPTIGKREVFAVLSQKTGRLNFQPEKSDVSASLDLGYTYGTSQFIPDGGHENLVASGNYVRIWKRQDGQWKIVLDIENPLSSPSN